MGSRSKDTTAPPDRAPAGRWRRRSRVAALRGRRRRRRWRSAVDRRAQLADRAAPATRRRRSAPQIDAHLGRARGRPAAGDRRRPARGAALRGARGRASPRGAARVRPSRRAEQASPALASSSAARSTRSPTGWSAIYRDGMPDATPILLESDGFDDFQTRAEYLRRIEDADAALVGRVRALRNRVSAQLAAVERGRGARRGLQRADRGRPRSDLRRPRRRRIAGARSSPACAPSARPRSTGCSRRSAAGPTRSSGSSGSPPARPRARSASGSATGRSPSRS